MRNALLRAMGMVSMLVLLLPAVSSAQSAIGGVVRDTSGGVLPGVTVEASSPALIEKTRTVVTDDQGVYRIVDLRPGAYTVTFSLAGFSTVRRDGIQLPDAFTATVNADLRVGSLEETITVSGDAPLVDVQNVAQRNVLSNELTDALPSSRFVQGIVSFLPGVTGTTLGVVGLDTRVLAIHGNRHGELILAIDGYSTNFTAGYTGVSSSFFINQAITQETNVQTGGAPAEQQWSGILTNIIPKEGSNNFTGYLFGSYSNESMQASNLTDELKAKGLKEVGKNRKLHNLNPGFGGRILRDRLWFYGAALYAGTDRWRPGVYYDKDPLDWTYTPDLTRQAHSEIIDYDYNLRLTLQATPRNKVIVYFDQQPHWVVHRNADGAVAGGLTFAPEAFDYTAYWPNVLTNATWKSPVSNRLLLEAGVGAYLSAINRRPPRDVVVPLGVVPALDLSNNIRFRAAWPNSSPAAVGGAGAGFLISHSISSRASASYITGSHAFKGGVQFWHGTVYNTTDANDYAVTLLSGTPRSVTQLVKPQDTDNRAVDIGLYGQDQWTYKRTTLNYGLRFDFLRGYIPPQQLPAGAYVPARNYAEVKNVPNYKDLSPRFGISYDLFGDGRTALKGTVNRYVNAGGTSVAAPNNPVVLSVLQVTRTWTDANENFTPDCDLANPLANGECLQVSDVNFGKADPRNQGYNPDLLTGWGVRPYNWEISAQLQRELGFGMSANVGYFRRWYGNFTAVDNLAVTPADHSHYCVTAPVNSGLPGGGGYQVCDRYDVSVAKFAQIQNQVNSQDKYGDRTENWNGVDLTVNARLPQGASVNGGLSTGRSHTVNCAVVDLPTVQYCDTLQPFQTQIKFMGRYPLPWWGLEASGVLQNVPGPFLTATAAYTSAQVRESLGRNLSGATATVTVPLIQPNTVNLNRQTQIDLRLSKTFVFGRARLLGSVDLYNLLNANSIQAFNNRISTTWPTPHDIQPARYVAVSGQLNF